MVSQVADTRVRECHRCTACSSRGRNYESTDPDLGEGIPLSWIHQLLFCRQTWPVVSTDTYAHVLIYLLGPETVNPPNSVLTGNEKKLVPIRPRGELSDEIVDYLSSAVSWMRSVYTIEH